MNVEGLQRKVEGWIKDHTSKFPKLQLPPWSQLQWVRVKWPPWSSDKEHRRKLQEEYETKRKQLQDLCCAIKAESVSDLQDILCCMVLSESVYKVFVILYLFCFCKFFLKCFICCLEFEF